MYQGLASRIERSKAFFCALAGAAVLVLMAPIAAARPIYVSDGSSNSVSVVDSHSRQVLARIEFGSAAPNFHTLAISPDGSRLFVTNGATNDVSVIDTTTNRVVGGPIPVGIGPEGIAIAPDGRRAYVANVGTDTQAETTVSVIDTASNLVVGTIDVGEGPSDVAFAPDGSRAYVTNRTSNDVSVIDTGTEQAGTPIPVGETPSQIAIAPDGSRAYVTNQTSDNVSAIDTATSAVLATIEVGEQPIGAAISSDSAHVYVANPGSESVSVIDAHANARIGEITGLPAPRAIALVPGGTTAYVGGDKPNVVSTIDTIANQVVGGPIPIGAGPGDLAIGPDRAPIASFSASRARPGVPARFDASASKDSDGGTIARYAWAFGDGRTGTLPASHATHVYGRPGIYRVGLTVSDDEGCSTSQILVGSTVSCPGSAGASETKVVKVAYPGVRVRCPKSAAPGGCRFALQAVAAGPKRGKPPKAQSAIAKAKVKPNTLAIVPLKPKPAFSKKLARASAVLVKETRKAAGAVRVRFRRLKIVQ